MGGHVLEKYVETHKAVNLKKPGNQQEGKGAVGTKGCMRKKEMAQVASVKLRVTVGSTLCRIE